MSIKEYKLTLKTLTNLHIGSGETLLSFDYFLGNEQFLFVDDNLLAGELIKRNLENDFIELINKRTSNQSRNIRLVLRELGFDNLNPIVSHIIDGKIKYGKNGKGMFKPIETFIRNGNGDVYVPGSSIKGFISNVLNLSEKEQKEVGNYLSISDSNIIDIKNLWITTVSYYQNASDDKKPALPNDGQSNYVEFIKPKTKITFNVKVDTKYIDLNLFKENLVNFNYNYHELFERKFEAKNTRGQYNCLDDYDEVYNGDIFRLGKYTSFLLKTDYLSHQYKSGEELFNAVKSVRRFAGSRKIKQNLEKKSNQKQRYPLALKVSLIPQGYYTENGICAYNFEEIK
ncbi:MAG: type III-A CRISPR-associated RAMP protein Csm5 [Acholeplasmatales bacterium]|jgi:CRISPR/Cas system CSM-associated protein Csm5 (group 7 of RAMP superfamily)|nr:type III-A CRISPR-associated RAMP protein Csm5 [Acholeplasmataceae bacterium]MCK9293261.1 type III-A CRISPR-associated RAMP protein Csm5 [archaeon]MCK9439456.1 type III-A CRISPR-associated RAMP protein Csm5 [Patescibacteria group bacterium]MDY0115918.1 type III-A CRISPR-associated RAMP protein Csm5 [Acholeplasmatales bacterium]